jgi:DNA mismatch endonuclease (patch repair protein)
MTDVLTPAQRKFNMSRIRNKDTRPEMIVRSLVHRMGYRYVLHNPKLPGKPDLVLSRHHKIIFVHGCFWHMHKCHYGKVKPKTRASFWQNKRMGNIIRDRKNLATLKREGWRVLVVWECWTRDLETLENRLVAFLQK